MSKKYNFVEKETAYSNLKNSMENLGSAIEKISEGKHLSNVHLMYYNSIINHVKEGTEYFNQKVPSDEKEKISGYLEDIMLKCKKLENLISKFNSY